MPFGDSELAPDQHVQLHSPIIELHWPLTILSMKLFLTNKQKVWLSDQTVDAQADLELHCQHTTNKGKRQMLPLSE